MRVKPEGDPARVEAWDPESWDYNIPVTQEQLDAGVVITRMKPRPAQFRLADGTIIEETWPPPR